MESQVASPLVLALMCLTRCLLPVAALLGVSYLLRRFGLIPGSPGEGSHAQAEQGEGHLGGGLRHGEN
jgi:hypothetical protein